jgi:hypothetical protein
MSTLGTSRARSTPSANLLPDGVPCRINALSSFLLVVLKLPCISFFFLARLCSTSCSYCLSLTLANLCRCSHFFFTHRRCNSPTIDLLPIEPQGTAYKFGSCTAHSHRHSRTFSFHQSHPFNFTASYNSLFLICSRPWLFSTHCFTHCSGLMSPPIHP